MFVIATFVGLINLIGIVFTARSIYRFLRKHPSLGRTQHAAVTTSVVFVGVLAALMAAPFFHMPSGLLLYGLLAIYLTFFVVGIRHILKWVWAAEKAEEEDC